jgi:hypothetical protein
VVLRANKKNAHLTDAEQRLVEALETEWGKADGYPEVPEDSGYEAGELVSAEELTGEVEETIDEIKDRERKQERWNHLIDTTPGLNRRLPNVNPTEVEEAISDAKRSGEQQIITSLTAWCDGSVRECNTDRIVYTATPEGVVETERLHMH